MVALQTGEVEVTNGETHIIADAAHAEYVVDKLGAWLCASTNCDEKNYPELCKNVVGLLNKSTQEQISPDIFLHSYLLICEFCEASEMYLDDHSVLSVWAAAWATSCKVLENTRYSDEDYCQSCGITVEMLNELEMHLRWCLDDNVVMNHDEMYKLYQLTLTN